MPKNDNKLGWAQIVSIRNRPAQKDPI